MQEKEVALRYRLQMTVIKREGTGEVPGEAREQVVERLRDIAATAGIFLSQKEGDDGRMMEAIGSRIHGFFGRRDAEVLEMITLEGVPAEIQTGGALEGEVMYGNYRSAAKYRGKILRKAVTDVALDNAILFPEVQARAIAGLRVSPVGVI